MPGFFRSPLDEIKTIRHLLADVYKDAGDGRTLLRELVQNADDAKARRLSLAVLEGGWPDAQNSLLHGPALVVVNDGAFRRKHQEGLHKAIGGSKEDDAAKIGTFGLGLKSVFHFCEAFLYTGAAKESNWGASVLNPWVGEAKKKGPRQPNWDKVTEDDCERLRDVATELLEPTSRGLLLWIPLRRDDHLDRGKTGNFGTCCPETADLCERFGRSTPAALLLAQCGHLRTIDLAHASSPRDISNRSELMRVSRKKKARWVGRPQNDADGFRERPFKGKIVSKDRSWSVVGVETLGDKDLRQLRSQVSQKALAHAAVTVLRPDDLDDGPLGTRLRWAVFLPLDDDPEPRSSAIVESKGSSPAWEIILHGYCWPSYDRRSIPGVTEGTDNSASDGDMRIRWNQALCDNLLLPLLPSVLAKAVDKVDERAARSLLATVARSDMIKVESRRVSVRRRHWLLPIVAEGGVRWKALDANSRPVLSIPKWNRASDVVRRSFAGACDKCTADTVFIDEDAPRLADGLDDWTSDALKRLLASIPIGEFGSVQSLRWIKRVVHHVLGPDACGGDIRAGVVARWLVARIADGALAYTAQRSVSPESQVELQRAWRNLCEALPTAWLVETPVDSQLAVAELAKEDDVIGEGLFPMPFSTGQANRHRPAELDQERLDHALSALGRKLQAGCESELGRSRLLLADVLFSRRDSRPLGDLEGLPLLRATRLPENREEAWSIADLRSVIMDRRVFSARSREPDGRSDEKRAATELAKALDKAVWLVSKKAVTSIDDDVPSPKKPKALAGAVLRAKGFAPPTDRKPLLMRLAPGISDSPKARRAVRALLAGRDADVVGKKVELFLTDDRPQSDALRILLCLLDRSWCAVHWTLVKSLTQAAVKALSVRRVDGRALHRLLDECLSKSVHWPGLGAKEALLLLQHLSGKTRKEKKRWRKMPLHRGVDGVRGPFNRQARLSTGKADELRLPTELEGEVRLLDPDPKVAHLYDAVPVLDRDGVLSAMLNADRPWRFARQIVQSIRSAAGPIVLPEDPKLRKLLGRACWLPHCNGNKGLAPKAILVAPDEVLNVVAGLAAARAFGDKWLPKAVDPEIWQSAEPVVRKVLGHLGRDRQITRMVDALDSGLITGLDGGAWLVMPDPELVDASLIQDALCTTLAAHHRGWKMVHTVAQILRRETDGSGSREAPQLLVKLAKALCASIPRERQIAMLKMLADSKQAKDSPGGRVFRRFLEGFSNTNDFQHVLQNITLPTQDGNWHASQDVATTATGVARRHRLIPELRPVLGLDGDSVPHAALPQSGGNEPESDTLKKYFESWRGRVPRGAVGAFLGLLGPRSCHGLAQWLGEDGAIEPPEGVNRDNDAEWLVEDKYGACVDELRINVVRGDRVSVVNVLGWRVEMTADTDGDTLFASDPNRYPFRSDGRLYAIWAITLRDVGPKNRSRSELMRLLGDTVKRWACQYLGLDGDHVKAWWSRWGEGSQAEVGPVLASIKAHLPLTLRQLNVQQNEPLRDALRKAEQAQRRREQAPTKKTLKNEKRALDRLATLMEEHQAFLWSRVNEVMLRYGYGRDSTLLELAQNADDALNQAAEVTGRPLPAATRRLLIEVHEHDGKPAVDVLHWGRPINDTGGDDFPDGRGRQWDQDLYFMMLMNLSGKPGETSGGSSSATTGRFGLGFKSIHLVSSSPSVVSDFIAFSIAGGLLPREQAVPVEMDRRVIEGRRPTRVRMPLREDFEAQTLIKELFRRFAYARALLPVFARQVREVIVKGGPFPGVHVFDDKPVGGALGWSVGDETELPNHAGRWRILRFRPTDAGLEHMGTAALAVGLRKNLPTALGPDVPFLWNIAPTSESWGCGYAVNGPIKLDPGRTHVSLDDETTLRIAHDLGEALGKGLIKLHDVLDCRTDEARRSFLDVDSRDFLSSLWKVLANGLDNPDELRRTFLLRLHGNGRGLSAWMAVRSVVPSGLPAPFRPILPPLTSDVRIEIASDGLKDAHLCAVLDDIEDEDLTALVDSCCIVSEGVARLLQPLCLTDTEEDRIDPTPLRPCDLFARLAKRWDHCLTPERLHALRPINGGGDYDFIAYDPQGVTWRSPLKARAADGSLQPLRNLLLRLPTDLFDDLTDGEREDELLRAAFAPENRILDPAYIERREDLQVFRWLRVQHRVDAAMMAKWYSDLSKDLRPAAIHYLLHGEIRFNVMRHLVPLDERPRWLREYYDVWQLAEDRCEEPWRRQSLLDELFPDRSHVLESLRKPLGPIRPKPDTFFDQFLDWWDDDAERAKVISNYERRAWPLWLHSVGDGLRRTDDSVDHWLALLVLGACRSFGRTRDQQHRSFLEMAHREGWWDVFKDPDEPGAWMKVLRDWQDGALAKLAYPQWMSLFPAIYQLSLHRGDYVDLLRSAEQRENMSGVTGLLAPRVDEELSGTGIDAPPAPLNMGLHWVLRELVRLEVVSGEHLFPHCWVPSEQVLNFLQPFGLELDKSLPNAEKAQAIFAFLAPRLGTEAPNLHRAFDIPLRHVAGNKDLRRRFGLEE